jgi:beta-glucosidase/6-phospho-beta-glucosidase/beta-galactosidase
MRRFLVACICAAAAAAVFTSGALADSRVVYGVQDDAWLTYGSGTLETRLTALDRLGVDVYRYTLHWNEIEPRRGSFRWQNADAILRGLQARGIQPVVTIYGSPGWANGGRGPNVAPRSASTFGAFARAAARRYRFVRYWTVRNEPNQRVSLLPASPSG